MRSDDLVGVGERAPSHDMKLLSVWQFDDAKGVTGSPELPNAQTPKLPNSQTIH